MTRHRFYKMTGSGNDFVFLDGRDTKPEEWPEERIRAVCARRTGVGADGLVILEPISASRVRFHYFNADGSRGEMCGNASLCAATLAPILNLTPGPDTILETDSGPVSALRDPQVDRASITLADAVGVADISGQLPLLPGETDVWAARVGVPHAVVVVEDIQATSANPLTRGRELRHASLFAPHGTNANFVARESDGWAYRTFERGVEAETLACGTGAVAVAAVLRRIGLAELPLDLRTHSGDTVTVSSADETGSVVLTGQGRLVFHGEMELLV